jgi:TonB family protein
VVCLVASIGAAQTGPPVPEAVRLDHHAAARRLLSEEKPEYPALAKANYIQGAVRLGLRVTREGRVGEAHVIRGHPFLAEAALQAVRRWVYRPLRRGSEATEFQTVVDVKFSLRARSVERLPPQPERDLDRQVRPPALLGRPEASESAPSVRMRVLVGATGQTLDSEPLTGPASRFAAARRQVEHWTFSPARWGNHSVPWYLDVDVPVPDTPTLPKHAVP